MSAPADRPLSLARLRLLPEGTVVVDRDGDTWVKVSAASERRRGWWRYSAGGVVPTEHLHHVYGPLYLVALPVTSSVPSGDGS